jgi:hypothetical protein
MPSGYPGSGPKKQGSKKDPKKDPKKDTKKKDPEHRKPHNAGEALVSLAIKPQGTTREGVYTSDGNQNNGSLPTGSSWRQSIGQPQQIPAQVSASNLSNFALGAPAPPFGPPSVNDYSTSDLPHMSFDAGYLVMMNDPLLGQGFVSDQGQGCDQWPASYQANTQANNVVINGTQQGFDRPFSYATLFSTNANVAGPSHSNTGAQSDVYGYNRQAMPYSAQHPGTIPYRNDYTQPYPFAVPPPPPPPSGVFNQSPGWYTMPSVQMFAAQQYSAQTNQQYQASAPFYQQYEASAPPPAPVFPESQISAYPIDQYQGDFIDATGNLGYNTSHIHEPALLRPASFQAPTFILADRAPEPSVPVDARSRKRRCNAAGGGYVIDEEVDGEEEAGPSQSQARSRQLARQAQRTAEEFRVLVESAASAVVAEHERQAEREAREEMPAEYRGEEQVPGTEPEGGDKVEEHSQDLDNGRQSPGNIHDSGYISQERNGEENAESASTGHEYHEAPPTDEANQSPPLDWSDLINYPESGSETEEQEIEKDGKYKRSG